MTGNDETLVVVCKRPKLGQGKQRLAESIGKESAFAVANSLLQCTLEDAMDWKGQLVFAVAHDEDIEWAKTLVPRAYNVMIQGQGNLGERLNFIDKTLRMNGYNKLVYIGTDAPMLTQTHYLEVSEQLQKSDIVLSRADDGGVTIMANSQPWPNIKVLPWSTSQLAVTLAESCRNSGLDISYVTPSYDIDVVEDLIRLRKDIYQDTRITRLQLLEVIDKLTPDNFTNHKHF